MPMAYISVYFAIVLSRTRWIFRSLGSWYDYDNDNNNDNDDDDDDADDDGNDDDLMDRRQRLPRGGQLHLDRRHGLELHQLEA